MKLFTREEDGPDSLNRLESKLDGGRQLLLEGEGGQDVYHQWLLTYFLRTSKSGRYFGLEVAAYGDPDSSYEEEGGDVELKIVLEYPQTPTPPPTSILPLHTHDTTSHQPS